MDLSELGIKFVFGSGDEIKPPRNKGKSLFDFPDNYVVVDIETTGLSPQYDCIIEISALKCIDNEIVDRYSTLVKPPFEIDDYITELTGITNEMLKDAPAIQDVIMSFINFVGDGLILGHNVNFDINFIYDNYYDITGKEFNNNFVDLLRISRKLFPDLSSHKLSVLANEFKIDNIPTHRGLDDCIATLECYHYCKKYVADNEINYKKSFKPLDLRSLTAENTDFDVSHPLYGKVCVFTGKLERLTRAQAAQLVVNIGGVCDNSVTARTNYLILGNNDYCKSIKDGKSSKQKKAEKLILAGQDLQVLPEDMFYELITEKGDFI